MDTAFQSYLVAGSTVLLLNQQGGKLSGKASNVIFSLAGKCQVGTAVYRECRLNGELEEAFGGLRPPDHVNGCTEV